MTPVHIICTNIINSKQSCIKNFIILTKSLYLDINYIMQKHFGSDEKEIKPSYEYNGLSLGLHS